MESGCETGLKAVLVSRALVELACPLRMLVIEGGVS